VVEDILSGIVSSSFRGSMPGRQLMSLSHPGRRG